MEETSINELLQHVCANSIMVVFYPGKKMLNRECGGYLGSGLLIFFERAFLRSLLF